MAQNVLARTLRQARRGTRISQATLAARTGLAVRTIRNLEHGRGTLASLARALKALKLALVGRHLPPGRNIGARIADLRQRRRVSQRALAADAGVTQPTIVALERRNRGRLETLDRVLTLLGAGQRIMPATEAPSFYASTANSSAHHNWHTPPELLDALYARGLAFDLDPCSPTKDRRRAPVKAKAHYVEDDDALGMVWHGRVFVNPPYGRDIVRWIEKAQRSVIERDATFVLALVPARTETKWWHEHVANRAHVFLLKGRLAFGDGTNSAPFPSALVLWGDTTTADRVAAAVPEAWRINALPARP
jgi:phage N-6-adenine-methyltransferase